MKGLDIPVDLDRRFQIEGLCFLGVRVPTILHVEMAKYSFLRVAREMPRLRELRPATPVRSFSVGSFPCELPKMGPLNPDIRSVSDSKAQPISDSWPIIVTAEEPFDPRPCIRFLWVPA